MCDIISHYHLHKKEVSKKTKTTYKENSDSIDYLKAGFHKVGQSI